MAEVVLQPTPEVLLDERFHQPPGLFPIAQLRGDPEEQARTKISPFLGGTLLCWEQQTSGLRSKQPHAALYRFASMTSCDFPGHPGRQVKLVGFSLF